MWRDLLFPDEPRDFLGRRTLKGIFRAAHVLCAGVLLGAYAFDVERAVRIGWLLAAMGTGCLILLLDLYESAAMLLQVRGLVVLFKLALLATVPWLGVWALGFIVLVSVYSSHAPASFRHRNLIGGIKGSETKG